MHRILIFLFAITYLIQFSCKPSTEKITPEKVVRGYINGLNESNFKQIEPYISDSLVTMESGFVLTQSSKDYYIHFQWDSVFSPEYNIINLKSISQNSVEVTLSKTCKRIKYLHDTATIYKAKIDLKNNHIVKIDNFELIVFDTLKWSSRRDTLVTWIKLNHPDLDGFVYDQTPTGAKKYLKAIDLFKTENQMTNIKDSKNLLIVKEFVSAINSADIERIVELMSADHKFIDSQNNTIIGKENNKKAWISYLNWFPTFKIEIESVFEKDSTVALFGFAEGTYKTKKSENNNHWKVPTAWMAKIEGMKIKQWQVYTDSKPVFDIIENNK